QKQRPLLRRLPNSLRSTKGPSSALVELPEKAQLLLQAELKVPLTQKETKDDRLVQWMVAQSWEKEAVREQIQVRAIVLTWLVGILRPDPISMIVSLRVMARLSSKSQ